jgi:ABC-type nitrate/sulfonate/bicarbonate transport system substrate-binding protein
MQSLTFLAAAALGVAVIATPVAAEPLKIKLQYATVGQFVPMIPLAPKELYRHYGKSYVVEPIFMAGAGPAITAFAAGEVHLAALNPQSIANAAISAKLEMRSIAQVLSTDMPGFAGGQYWCQDHIKTVADLKGKTIGINTRGSTPEAAARVYLSRHGLESGRDYQPVEMPFPNSLPALDGKRVDCAVLVSPWVHQIATRPGMRMLFTIGEVLGPSESVTWVGKPEWVAKNRATLVDFLEDHIRMRRWMLDPKTHPEAIKLTAQVAKQPVERVEYLFTGKDNFHHPDAWIDAVRFQKNVDDLHKLGVTPGTIDAKKVIDTSIQQEALARVNRGT